jgi:hypothetical protein
MSRALPLDLFGPVPIRPHERWMRLVALAIIGAMAVVNVVWTLQTWPMGDIQIYWDAGQRIANGEPLYPGSSPYTSYRYAPWFAWLWAGFAILPYWLVAALWQIALLAACVAVAIPFVRRGLIGVAFAGLMVPLLFAVSAGGNVQALLVVSLLYGMDRRTGPVWIAVAASLRATPILFVAVYAARREWTRFWVTLGLTTVLVAPMLLYNPETLVADVAGREPGLLSVSPILYLVVAATSLTVVGLLAYRRSPYTVLAAAAGAVLASPKLFGYDVTTLAAVNPDSPDPTNRADATTSDQ